MTKFGSDADLINHIRKGRTENKIFGGNRQGIINIGQLFSGIEPANFYQNLQTGENRIEKARAARFSILSHDVGDDLPLKDAVTQFNALSEHISVSMSPPKGNRIELED